MFPSPKKILLSFETYFSEETEGIQNSFKSGYIDVRN